jgi:hypothetical protein
MTISLYLYLSGQSNFKGISKNSPRHKHLNVSVLNAKKLLCFFLKFMI